MPQTRGDTLTVNFWLYVSRCCIAEHNTAAEVHDIVQCALARNPVLGITGALLFGDGHFAQIIEGPAGGLLTLRTAILRDQRHKEVKTIADGKTEGRRFEGWSLAYSGPSMVVSRAIQRALRDSAQGYADAGGQLLELMADLTGPR